MEIPKPRRSRAEIEAEVADLNRSVDAHNAREQAALAKEADDTLSRRAWDWDFGRRWDRTHGSVDTCTCLSCTAWRESRARR